MESLLLHRRGCPAGRGRLPLSILASLFFLVLLLLQIGCGSGGEVATGTPESRFANAKQLFDDGDYLEAINEFTALTLQFQGSAVAADAQFYLGECRYERQEWLLSAYEFSVFKRSYAANPRVADAQYRLAMSYYELSPKFSLDQQYTKKAIDEFQSFVEYYPGHALALQAEEKIKELNTRLAYKQYRTAQLYVKMDYIRAALLSYDQVIEKYHDTEYAPPAYIEKVELLMSRERYQEASLEINKFLARYPTSTLTARGENLRDEIDRELNRWKRPAGSGAAPDTTRSAGATSAAGR